MKAEIAGTQTSCAYSNFIFWFLKTFYKSITKQYLKHLFAGEIFTAFLTGTLHVLCSSRCVRRCYNRGVTIGVTVGATIGGVAVAQLLSCV